MTDEEQDLAATYLEGPLFKRASPTKVYLEAYDHAWRAGAQAIGYREAAETLMDAIIDRDRPTSRTLLHPLLFLYRHSVELRLKHLIEEYGGGPAPLGHELDKLWPPCREIVTPYASEEDIEKVGRLVAELHAVDPRSETFRYATTRKGEPIEIKFDVVDLVHLQKQMDDLDTFFFGVEAWMQSSHS